MRDTGNELVPESIVNRGGVMRIRWPDGLARSFGDAFLREHCRCAQCKSLRRDAETAVAADDGPRITEIHPVGSYAIQLVFSDGHRRGIYPWAYLRALCEGEEGAR